jgi:hypothetical protein
MVYPQLLVEEVNSSARRTLVGVDVVPEQVRLADGANNIPI